MNCVAMIDDYLSPKIFSSMSKGDGHYGSRLHDPGKGVPHEAQELEHFALLQHYIIFVIIKVLALDVLFCLSLASC